MLPAQGHRRYVASLWSRCLLLLSLGSVLTDIMLPQMGIVNGRYRYIQDLLDLEFQHHDIPPAWCTRGPSPLRLDLLETYMCHHPDVQFAAYMYCGLTYGFHVSFSHASHHLYQPLVTTHHHRTEEVSSPTSCWRNYNWDDWWDQYQKHWFLRSTQAQ